MATGFKIIKEEEYTENVYDIEVQDNHNFYNEGILVHNCFISLLPKMYFANKVWDEGKFINKPKLKITGLSTIRSSTPKFFRKELEKSMYILIKGDLESVIEYIESVKKETFNKSPSEICINQGVSSLDYTYEPDIKKFRRYVPEKDKYLSAPVNSRASLIHNLYVNKNELHKKNIKPIEAGDKIGFLYLKEPNVALNSNVFAFKQEDVFNYGLKESIDYNTMFEKGFLKSIKLITDPLKWDLTPKEDLILDDDW